MSTVSVPWLPAPRTSGREPCGAAGAHGAAGVGGVRLWGASLGPVLCTEAHTAPLCGRASWEGRALPEHPRRKQRIPPFSWLRQTGVGLGFCPLPELRSKQINSLELLGPLAR